MVRALAMAGPQPHCHLPLRLDAKHAGQPSQGVDRLGGRRPAQGDGHVLALGDPARLEDVVAALACHH